MNNIQDNPARVAPPESPVKPDLKKLKHDFLDVYIDTDNTDSAFHEALEEYICANGLIHHWLRKLYTIDRDEVALDMDDLLKSVISNYIEENL
jgi:hypothetical protein